tara:strand:+ start:473 stop:1510 length:1038 start_codon:yes stop_codon:yes gene_type:complete
MKIIDLRSDTITLPSQEMSDAIFKAQLGDDVFSEDENVNLLESKAATLSGKEAALLVPSGTMANLISFLVHCPRGTEAILGDKSHTFIYEAGGISAFGGIHSHQLRNDMDGLIDLEEIKKSIREDNVHFPQTSLISLENTHNKCFGAPIPREYIQEVINIAHENDLKTHIDGARIFNATAALDIELSDLVDGIDSITFCLSKGLSCPIGSLVCGSKDFIYHARRTRKALGGGMRQAGIIAAAGLVALENSDKQIHKDHKNAKLLAEGLSTINHISIDVNRVQTNIVYFKLSNDIMESNKFLKAMEDAGVLFFESFANQYRLVTHYGIHESDIYNAVEIFKKHLSF